jgi:hypothetical protein
MTAVITGLVVIVFALVMTKPGQAIDAATQHFMLFYAGVFALIGLTASVGVGLVATDRIVMTPGHRVMARRYTGPCRSAPWPSWSSTS